MGKPNIYSCLPKICSSDNSATKSYKKGEDMVIVISTLLHVLILKHMYYDILIHTGKKKYIIIASCLSIWNKYQNLSSYFSV